MEGNVMTVEQILDAMDDMLDKALAIPLSGGKCMMNADHFRDLIGDIRLNLPQEIKQSKIIINDRKAILDDAKREAENIVRVAEERARRLVDENEIIRKVKEQATEMARAANVQSRDIKRAANEYANNILKTTEQSLIDSLNQVKEGRAALHSQATGQRKNSFDLE